MLNRPLHRVGLDLRRWSPTVDFEAVRGELIREAGVDLVVDVGANQGQYAGELRRSGYRGPIISLEPLAEAFEVLAAKSDGDTAWRAIRGAAGSREERLDLRVAGNSVSSSFLPMLDRHLEAAPRSAEVGLESVEVNTLDRLLFPDLERSATSFIKIDTQGFEREVLAGADRMLDSGKVVGIEIELSLVALYEGAPLWAEMIDLLREQGFVPLAFGKGYRDPGNGELVQLDGLFAPRETG